MNTLSKYASYNELFHVKGRLALTSMNVGAAIAFIALVESIR